MMGVGVEDDEDGGWRMEGGGWKEKEMFMPSTIMSDLRLLLMAMRLLTIFVYFLSSKRRMYSLFSIGYRPS